MFTNQYIYTMKNLLYSGTIKRLSTPIEVYLELTNKCNIECSYCYKRAKVDLSEVMLSVEIVEKLMKDLSQDLSSPVLFVLEGGEPLINPFIADIIAIIKTYNYSIDLLTNSLLLNRKHISQITKYWDTSNDEVQVSLDGPGLVNSWTRGNSGDLIIEKISLLNEYNIVPRVNTVVTKDNIFFIPQLLSKLDRSVQISNITLSSVMGKANRHMAVEKKMKEKLSDFLDKCVFSFPVYKNYTHYSPRSIPCSLPANTTQTNEYYSRCTALTGKVCIAANGDVYPCVFYEGVIKPLGNLNERTIIDIWNSDESRIFLEKKNELQKKCHHCINNKNCAQICAGAVL